MEILLQGDQFTNREAAHTYLAQQLSAPTYYGRNLDALFDILTDIGQPTVITITQTEALCAALGSYGDVLLRVFQEAADDNTNLTIRLFPTAAGTQ